VTATAKTAYLGRNVREGAFNGFKHWRGLATRYDKHVVVYRGGLVLAAALIWLAE
jgi:transposase